VGAARQTRVHVREDPVGVRVEVDRPTMRLGPKVDLVVGLADAADQARLTLVQVGDLGDGRRVEVVVGPDVSSGVGAVCPI
jgi:hypothetical protein